MKKIVELLTKIREEFPYPDDEKKHSITLGEFGTLNLRVWFSSGVGLWRDFSFIESDFELSADALVAEVNKRFYGI